jgi:hypothetical protein
MKEALDDVMDNCFRKYAATLVKSRATTIAHVLLRLNKTIEQQGATAGDVVSRRADLLGASLGTQRFEFDVVSDSQVLKQYNNSLALRRKLWQDLAQCQHAEQLLRAGSKKSLAGCASIRL